MACEDCNEHYCECDEYVGLIRPVYPPADPETARVMQTMIDKGAPALMRTMPFVVQVVKGFEERGAAELMSSLPFTARSGDSYDFHTPLPVIQ